MTDSDTPPVLHRLTTAFNMAEDRISITGITVDGETHMVWLSQRLLNRLVPQLCGWLENNGAAQPGESGLKQSYKQAGIQAFEQEKARSGMSPKQPVASHPAGRSWLAVKVDAARGTSGVRLTFKSYSDEEVVLALPTQALRQWLAIVYSQARSAGWPTTGWPPWLAAEQVDLSAAGPLH